MFDLVNPKLPERLSVPFALIENAYTRLTRLVHDMSQEEIDYLGPAGNVNSTATLIQHLAFTDLEYLHCIKGEAIPEALMAEYGPDRTEDERLPVVKGQQVDQLLASYRRVIDLIEDYLQTCTDEDATATVTVPWWPESASVRYVLWHMAGHSMFHQGQIRRLREWYAQEHRS
ncbi:DinB family protein [Desmospora activa]|uniref:Putative damage-inducible protein DinB n=1 Tax=Desmospora activa DSM 45169 TaxID=1121389 RepID=A0A2T4Z7X1_9BACL|nr:DinB family protein [Desmospora activa]PTM57969.1 putative damage-inducible protein DinB [Desmospora activa DSM 45169]